MIEVSILVPVSDNSGVAYTATTDDAFGAELARLFNGFSRLPGTVAGGWFDAAGTYYPDESRVYVVALESIGDGGKVQQAAEAAKTIYAQKAIYVRYLGLSEIL
jgi:hypothetical protein